ncbi:MAG: DUF4870 domain-containing protein [Vicinamibacterales bacterium]
MSGPTQSGLAPNVLAALAYVAWWVTGLAVLALDRDHPFVRFHAWQSVIGLGALWALGVAFYFTAFLVLSVSAAGFTAMLWIAVIIWLIGLVAWIVCLLKAWNGQWWKLPVVGAVAERYALP